MSKNLENMQIAAGDLGAVKGGASAWGVVKSDVPGNLRKGEAADRLRNSSSKARDLGWLWPLTPSR